MAHPSNLRWLRPLVGDDVRLPDPRSPEEIPAARAAYRFRPPGSLPKVAARHEGVPIRRRGDFELTAEVYVPQGEPPFPVVLYLHGGSFCVGSPADARWPAMRIAERGRVVVNLDYGLAPEHRFPWALEDVLYAARWLGLRAEDYGGDPGRMALAGDSAGANLAAVALIASRRSDLPLDEGDLAGVPLEPAALLLFFGIFDLPRARANPGSNAPLVELWWHRAYLGPEHDLLHHHPLVSPVYASPEVLAGFPPTYLAVGAEDSLVGHTLALAEALAWQNVAVTVSVASGLDHAFTYLEHTLPEARGEVERALDWLAEATSGPGGSPGR